MENTSNGAAPAVAPRIELNADGSQSIIGADGERVLLVPGATAIAGNEENLSPAMRALRELRGEEGAPPKIRALAAGGRTWFIKRLNYGELTKVGLLSPRNQNGELDILGNDSAAQFMAAMFYCTLASDENDASPFFETFSEAWQFAHDTSDAVIGVIGVLFHAILNLNPQLLPAARREEIDWDGEEREKKESPSAPSTMPPKTADTSSSSATHSSDAPA